MRNVAFIIMAYLVSMQICYAQTGNYVKTVTYLNNTKSDSIAFVQYYDGLGRAYLSASSGVSGNGNYVYTLSEYDLAGREIKKWFPVAGGNSLLMPTVGDIASMSVSTYNDDHAFITTKYDGLNRKTEIFTGGDVWDSNDKTNIMDYSVNTDNQVKYYTVTSSGVELSGFWPKGALTVEKTTDADNKTSLTYKNMYGDVVMTDNAGAKTYYVYNNRGLLVYVLTPQYQESADIDADAYKYEYDSYDRLSSKSLPGCFPILYTYNNANQLIAEQPPLLQEKGLIRFYYYDSVGRLCIQGVCSCNTYDASQYHLIVAFPSVPDYLIQPTGYLFPENKRCYSADDPNLVFEVINYYDDYKYLDKMPSIQTIKDKFQNSVLIDNLNSKGQLTGQIVSTTDGKQLLSSLYYDYRGLLIDERHSTLDNDVYLFTTEFSFTDKPMTTTEVLRHGQAVSYPMTTYYEYNERNDQLEKVTISQGGNNEIVSEITYNDLGQIETEARANNSDLVNYSYELHGWIKKIESPFFEEELYYADAINGLIPRYNGNISAQSWKADGKKHGYVFSYDRRDMMTKATYIEERSTSIAVSNKFNESATYNVNGGIASLTRKGKNNNNQYVNIDQLSYEYDGNKVKNITDSVTSKLSYKDAFEYRDMHNYIDDERDDFEYNHAGMLIKDRDKGITEITYNNIGLVDSICFGNGNRVKYVYAMTGEKLKVTHYTSRISLSSSRTDSSPYAIEAGTSGKAANNQLPYGSLPSTPELIDSLVSSSGQIQTGIQVPLVKSSETTYVGSNITFEMDGKYNYLFGSGYCEFKPCATYADSIKYYYYTKDHLGNVRNVISKNDSGIMEELQHTSYYPFGGIIADISTGRNVQNRLYNGKEQDFANNLFWLDYGARQYDPTAPRFISPDPLAEKYYPWNYYAYCMNNPVRFIDLFGLTPGDYYDTDGTWMGSDGIDDNKAYVVNNEGDSEYNGEKYSELSVGQDVLIGLGALIQNESSGNEAESMAIGSAVINFLNEGGSSQLKNLESVVMYDNYYSAAVSEKKYKEYANKGYYKSNNKYSMKSAINAVGFLDGIPCFKNYAGKADAWDGIDLVYSKYSNGHRRYRWTTSSKKILNDYRRANKGDVDTNTFMYVDKGAQVEALFITGGTVFQNVLTRHGEGKVHNSKRFRL